MRGPSFPTNPRTGNFPQPRPLCLVAGRLLHLETCFSLEGRDSFGSFPPPPDDAMPIGCATTGPGSSCLNCSWTSALAARCILARSTGSYHPNLESPFITAAANVDLAGNFFHGRGCLYKESRSPPWARLVRYFHCPSRIFSIATLHSVCDSLVPSKWSLH